jgi:hypothetical protein
MGDIGSELQDQPRADVYFFFPTDEDRAVVFFAEELPATLLPLTLLVPASLASARCFSFALAWGPKKKASHNANQ